MSRECPIYNYNAMSRKCPITYTRQCVSETLKLLGAKKKNHLNLHCISWNHNAHDVEIIISLHLDGGSSTISKGEHDVIFCYHSIWQTWLLPHNNITEWLHIQWHTGGCGRERRDVYEIHMEYCVEIKEDFTQQLHKAVSGQVLYSWNSRAMSVMKVTCF